MDNCISPTDVSLFISGTGRRISSVKNLTLKLKNYETVSILAWVLILATLTGCTSPNSYPNHTATGVLTGTAIGAGTAALLAGGHGRAGEAAVVGGAVGAIQVVPG